MTHDVSGAFRDVVGNRLDLFGQGAEFAAMGASADRPISLANQLINVFHWSHSKAWAKSQPTMIFERAIDVFRGFS
ncbi:hypothetical protein [Roseibium polysiphoniae]|uniref:hypothetical protein n=1 Tax=Roseibium polysiphoniae TaxID=2571221 RepID=UPI00329796A9